MLLIAMMAAMMVVVVVVVRTVSEVCAAGEGQGDRWEDSRGGDAKCGDVASAGVMPHLLSSSSQSPCQSSPNPEPVIAVLLP